MAKPVKVTPVTPEVRPKVTLENKTAQDYWNRADAVFDDPRFREENPDYTVRQYALDLIDDDMQLARDTGQSEWLIELRQARKIIKNITTELPIPKVPFKPAVKLTMAEEQELRGLKVIIGNIEAAKAEKQAWVESAGAKEQLESALKRQAELQAKVAPIVPVTQEVKPIAPFMVEGEAWYRNRWDTDKLGQRAVLAVKSGWVNNQGQLTKLGERIAQSKWAELSPAAQNILRGKLDALYGRPEKVVSPAIPKSEAGRAERLSPNYFEFYNTQYSLRQLREMAKTAGLSPSGLKEDLIRRLVEKGILS